MSLAKYSSRARTLCAFALTAALLSGSRVDAGTLLLSADSNIVDGLLGTNGFSLTAGNGTFFNNVLAGGKTVEILSTTLGVTGEPTSQLASLNTFYNGQAGVTSSIVSGPITTSLLANTKLFIDDLPDAALTTSEVAAVKGFLAGGGTFFLLTEAAGVTGYGASIAAASADLTSLGSSMRLTGVSLDASSHFATGANGQVLSNPLTSGVSSLQYAFTNGISGGQALFLDSDKATAFVSVEAGSSAVPEPSSILMVSTAMAAVALSLRRARSAGPRSSA